MVFDLSSLPEGKRYEDVYGQWLSVFVKAAENYLTPAVYRNVPRCWAPLLYYLGHSIEGERSEFFQDRWLMPDTYVTAHRRGHLREYVEATSSMRPEIVDALYKVDTQVFSDGKSAPRHTWQKEFTVTCNGSFFRPEIQMYLKGLPTYEPSKNYNLAILVPCAADKPYPSVLHKKVMEIAPNAHIIVATGVLGVVPQELWESQPFYDSGLPNEKRVTEMVRRYFSLFSYKKIVVYSDFYGPAIMHGLSLARIEDAVWCVQDFIVKWDEYINLLDPKVLRRLEDACRGV